MQSLVKAAPETGDEEEKPSTTKTGSKAPAPAPTTLIPPKHMNGTVITTTICPEVTSAIEAVASSSYPTAQMTFAPGPSGSEAMPGPSGFVSSPAGPSGPAETPGSGPSVAGASSLQKSGLGLVVFAMGAFALM